MALRLTQLRKAGFSHGNRVGYLGYGYKRHPDEVAPADTRAFRDLQINEVCLKRDHLPIILLNIKYLLLIYRFPDGWPTKISPSMPFSLVSEEDIWPGDGSTPFQSK